MGFSCFRALCNFTCVSVSVNTVRPTAFKSLEISEPKPEARVLVLVNEQITHCRNKLKVNLGVLDG